LELFNELSTGISAEAHPDIMTAYNDYLNAEKLLRNKTLPPKTKITPNEFSENTVSMQGYYMNKAPDLPLFDVHNPWITNEPL
jgi:hypothetical protein